MGKRKGRGTAAKANDLPWWAKYFKHNQHPDTIVVGARVIAAILLLCFAITGYMLGQDSEFKVGDLIVTTETFIIRESGDQFEPGTQGIVVRVPGDDDENSPAVVRIRDIAFDAPSGGRIVLRDSPQGLKAIEEKNHRNEAAVRQKEVLEKEAEEFVEQMEEEL